MNGKAFRTARFIFLMAAVLLLAGHIFTHLAPGSQSFLNCQACSTLETAICASAAVLIVLLSFERQRRCRLVAILSAKFAQLPLLRAPPVSA